MAYMCIKGFGECDACGYCEDTWDEDENEAFRDEDEYRPEDDWEEENV